MGKRIKVSSNPHVIRGLKKIKFDYLNFLEIFLTNYSNNVGGLTCFSSEKQTGLPPLWPVNPIARHRNPPVLGADAEGWTDLV